LAGIIARRTQSGRFAWGISGLGRSFARRHLAPRRVGADAQPCLPCHAGALGPEASSDRADSLSDRRRNSTHAITDTEIIRSLIDEIVLTPENGELKVDLKGDLAGILAIATNGKRSGASGSDRAGDGSQFELVAGVAFFSTHRYCPSMLAIVQDS